MKKDKAKVSNNLPRKVKKEVKKNLESAVEQLMENPEEFMKTLKPFTL